MGGRESLARDIPAPDDAGVTALLDAEASKLQAADDARTSPGGDTAESMSIYSDDADGPLIDSELGGDPDPSGQTPLRPAPAESASDPTPSGGESPDGVLDNRLRLAARAADWSDAEIDAHVKQVGGEQAASDFGTLEQRAINEFNGFGSATAGHGDFLEPGIPAGSQTSPQAFSPVPGDNPPAQPAGGTPPSGQEGQQGFVPLSDEKIARIRDEQGDDIADTIKSLNDQGKMNHEWQQRQEQVLIAQNNARAQENIETFFNEITANDKGLALLYGLGNEPRTRQQNDVRSQVVIGATGLMGAHQQTRRPISPPTALLRAHLGVSAAQMADSGRRQVEQQVVSRSHNMSTPPGRPGGGHTRKPGPYAKAKAGIIKWHQDRDLPVPGPDG